MSNGALMFAIALIIITVIGLISGHMETRKRPDKTSK